MKKEQSWWVAWLYFAGTILFRIGGAVCLIAFVNEGSWGSIGGLLFCLIAIAAIESFFPYKEETRFLVPFGGLLGMVVLTVWLLLFIKQNPSRPSSDLYGGVAFFLVCLELVCEYGVWWLGVAAKKIIGLQES